MYHGSFEGTFNRVCFVFVSFSLCVMCLVHLRSMFVLRGSFVVVFRSMLVLFRSVVVPFQLFILRSFFAFCLAMFVHCLFSVVFVGLCAPCSRFVVPCSSQNVSFRLIRFTRQKRNRKPTKNDRRRKYWDREEMVEGWRERRKKNHKNKTRR